MTETARRLTMLAHTALQPLEAGQDRDVTVASPLTAEEEERLGRVTRDGYAENTALAYESRLRQYLSWLASTNRDTAAAFQPRVVAAYLSWLAHEAPPIREGGPAGRKLSTIEQSLASILRVARSRGEDADAIKRSQVVNDVMRGIRRNSRLNRRPAQAHAFSMDEIRRLFTYLHDTPGNTSVRDLSLLSLGLATGMRASEICALRWEDVTRDEQNRGIVITIQHSKTSTLPVDIPVAKLSTMHASKCPVALLEAWKQVQQEALGLDSDAMKTTPLFTRVRRGGHVTAEPLGGDEAVSRLLRRLCDRAGVSTENVKSHSLRATMATRSLQSGHADLAGIMAVGRWSSTSILLSTYDRRDPFERIEHGSTSDFLAGA